MSKINKLGKSTFLVAILSFLLVAVLAFGGTYAFFSAKAENLSSEDNLQLGTLTLASITGTSAVWTTDTTIYAVPNEEVFADEAVTVSTAGTTIEYFMRVKLSTVVTPTNVALTNHKVGGDQTGETKCGDYEANNKIIEAVLDSTLVGTGAGKWTLDSDGYYYLNYNKVVTDQETGAYTIGYTGDQTLLLDAKVESWVGADGCRYYMGAGVVFTVEAEAIQADWLPASVTDTASLADAWEDSIVEHAKTPAQAG